MNEIAMVKMGRPMRAVLPSRAAPDWANGMNSGAYLPAGRGCYSPAMLDGRQRNGRQLAPGCNVEAGARQAIRNGIDDVARRLGCSKSDALARIAAESHVPEGELARAYAGGCTLSPRQMGRVAIAIERLEGSRYAQTKEHLPWTPEEVALLRAGETLPGRSHEAANRMRERLGIVLRRDAWTDEELAMARSGVRPPGRSLEAYYKKRYRLKEQGDA